MRYEELIKVDQKFYSVFNREVDDKNPELWKSFIPHRGFIDFLNRTINSLNRAKPQETKSIWLYGSYGTGKTFAVFVLKHLLEDREEDVEEYINSYQKLLGPFREKIKALRDERVLVVYKSSAGHVNSSVKLNLEVMNSIYDAYNKFKSRHNLRDEILPDDFELLISKLKESPIDWESFIKKYRHQLFHVKSKDEILLKLEKRDLYFASNLVDCLREEGFSHFAVNDVNEVKKWIESLLEMGFFSRILFIWDEFSEFFSENAPIFTFQELAHLTQKVPFYFLIVTHRQIDFWENKFGEDIRKLKDRFINIHFTMENITMYKLMSYVIKPIDDSRWLDFKREIIHKLTPKMNYEINKMMSLDESLTHEDIERVFPIHPYSVYLITKIVEYFGSTNRTVFDFMKSDRGFVRFTKEYPENGEYLLTLDFLWDFFFSESSEISTFYPKVKKWMNYWNMHYEKLDSEEEKKVFKAICLLFTLKEEILISDKGDKLLKPTLPTLKLAFSGTLIYGKINSILEKLNNIKIIKLYKPLFGDIEILEPTLDINQEDLERIKAELPDFSEFVKKYISAEEFKIHRRVNITVISDEDLIANRIPFLNYRSHEIPALLIIIKEGSDSKRLKDEIRGLAKRYTNYLFLLSLRELRQDEINRLKDEMALSRYYKDLNQYNQLKYHENNFKEILDNFIRNCKVGDFFVFLSYNEGEILERNCSGINNIELITKQEIIPKIFPYSLEDKILSDPLWINKNLNKKAINFALEPAQADKAFAVLINELIHGGFLDNTRSYIEGSLDKNYEHPIVKINNKVKEKLSEQGEVNLSILWDELNRPPFGIYDVPVGVFCFTFVLGNYIREFYVVDQQGYEIELSIDKLKAVIEDTVKGKKIWYLRSLSKEQQKFCEFINNAFDLNSRTPRDGVVSLREKVRREIKYPLWIANYTDLDLLTPAKELLNSLSDLILTSYEEKIENLTQQFKRFYEIISPLSEIELRNVIKDIRVLTSKLRDCFNNAVSQYLQIDETLNIDILENTIRERLQEDTYLWKEQSFIDLLKFIREEIAVVRKISEKLGLINVYLIDELVSEVRFLVKKGKLAPFWIYEKYFRDEKLNLLQQLFNPNLTYKDLVDSQLIQNLYNSLSHTEKLFSDMINQRDRIVREWIRERFETKANSIVSLIEREFWNIIHENQSLSEEQVYRELKLKVQNLKEKALREDIFDAIENLFGERNFDAFLRKNKIPLTMLHYFPEIANSEIFKNKNFFTDLLNIDKLTGDGLEIIKELISGNQTALRALSRDDSLEKILKRFLGEEWDDAIFDERDFFDFLNFYRNSDIRVDSSEGEILNIFKQWKKQKYLEILPSLEKTIASAEPEVLRDILHYLLKESEVGLHILKSLKHINLEI